MLLSNGVDLLHVKWNGISGFWHGCGEHGSLSLMTKSLHPPIPLCRCFSLLLLLYFFFCIMVMLILLVLRLKKEIEYKVLSRAFNGLYTKQLDCSFVLSCLFLSLFQTFLTCGLQPPTLSFIFLLHLHTPRRRFLLPNRRRSAHAISYSLTD